MTPFDAWTLRRLLCGHELNGELEAVSGPFRPLAVLLAETPVEVRVDAWGGFLCARDDADELIAALAAVDPDGSAPEARPPRRPASLADLRRTTADGRADDRVRPARKGVVTWD
jgi:hypothetical protein